ncbi:hypothetical protein JCM3770_002957 [Rhodotorula araucariae]
MAARKLQTEIDKTLKKVTEGVELFEGIFEKIQASSNQTQKEKLEQDLKTQIKKLQRLRDQIKTWMASNDIKDKQPLIDNRKLIETQMERFKACEKEMKTKAFSKEGLNAAAKLDPKEQQKLEMCQWIQSMVEELSRQVEQSEAEIETIQGTRQKKKDSEREARLEELERLNERREWHIGRLELILRLLENGNLPTDAVGNVKDDIAYFVESNTEEDFEEDEGIYDELNLEDEEDAFGMVLDEHHSSHESASVADEPAPPVPPIPKTPAKVAPKEEEKTPAKPKAPVAETPQKKASLDSTSSRPPAAAVSTPSRSVSGPASAQTPRTAAAAPPLPPIRYAAAAAAANASASPAAPAAPVVPSPGAPAGPPPGLSAPATSAPSPAPAAPAAASVADAASQASSAAPSPALAAPVAPSPSLSSASGAPASQRPASPSAPSASAASPAPPPTAAPAPLPAPASAEGGAADEHARAAAARQAAEARLPSSLADLVTSFESAKQKSAPLGVSADKSTRQPAMRRDQDLSEINAILEAGMSNVPQPLDAEKPKYYVPRNPYATPTYYPQEPSSQFASPALFAKLDVDTLFYIFYYCPGTYLQFLAANELKKQSWRFHKQYLTWFQRANEPTTITDSYEQGVYLYFDWEGAWCQRKKNDFRFVYDYLEQ